ALEGDLRMRRNRQTGARPDDDIDGFPDKAARHVVLVLAVRDFQPGYHEERGVHPNDNRDRTCLSALVVFAHDQIAMLALGAMYRGDIAALHLNPIGTVVDPAAIRVFHHHHAAGADEVASVLFVPLRGRDAVQIDLVTAVDVF